MKVICILAVMGMLLLPLAVFGAENFSVKEYEKFHDVLEPLQHEALPKRDFKRIRSDAVEFVRRGKKIVRIGVPAGVAKTKTAEFRKELKNFNTALARFSRDAKRANDAELQTSFSAVHDSFEVLAEMLPRR